MAEENNAFGEFGARSAKFDELIKKYGTISESDSADTASNAKVNDKAAEEKNVAENIAADEAKSAEATVAETVEQTPSVQTTESERATEEAAPAVQTEVVTASEPASVNEFSLDEQSADSEKVEDTQPEPEPEPDYSYDIETFGMDSAKTAIDIDSFDDSWLDTALDESVFYKADALFDDSKEEPVQFADIPKQADKPVPAPQPVKKKKKIQKAPKQKPVAAAPAASAEAEPQVQSIVGEIGFVDNTPDQADKNAMAGGYIAPSDFSDFAFDPESGLEFDFDIDSDKDALTPPPTKEKKKFSKAKPDSGKNEMTCVTGFSKAYKASEGKGSKKDNFFVRNFIPKKDDTSTEKARKIIMIACIAIFLIATTFLFREYVIVPLTTGIQLNKLEGMVGDGDKVADNASLAEKYPDVVFPENMLEKYAELYAENPDFVGWLRIDGLDISLPVVKGEDNEKYLKKDFKGSTSKYGSAFMNSANGIERLDFNTAIFAHNLKDSKMFGNLVEYKTPEGYKKAPVIEFNTLYADYKWKVFAVFITNGTPDKEDGYLFNYMFTDLSSQTAQSTEKFLGEISQRSLYYTNVDISPTDKILTLSTCSYEFDEARLVVMARMVRPGESETVNTSVRVNDNVRYPAVYYRENDISNPYASAYKWNP